jgi:hypothetical protein
MWCGSEPHIEQYATLIFTCSSPSTGSGMSQIWTFPLSASSFAVKLPKLTTVADFMRTLPPCFEFVFLVVL